jgi:predicted DNA-binding transcriptional regulator AlpA
VSGPVAVLDEAAIREIVTAALRAELQSVINAISALAKPPDLDALMTAEEVLAFLHIDRRSMQRLIHEGILPAGMKIGDRRLRWRRGTILAVIERLEQESQAPALRRSRSRGSVSPVTRASGDRA